MNPPPIPPILPIPPVIRPNRSITYELTRWDLFVNSMTVILRNRMLQIFILAGVTINGLLLLGPEFAKRSFSSSVLHAIGYVIAFLAIIAAAQCVMGLAQAFLLKQRGVVGQHVLEITEQGLIERTDCNETLHRWPSICRIMSLTGYLYVYVAEMNSHQIPKRCFPPQEMDGFEAELRARATQLKS